MGIEWTLLGTGSVALTPASTLLLVERTNGANLASALGSGAPR